MNTSKKGDKYENIVFEIFKDLLENEELFINGKKSKIYQKKKYPSIKTNTEVETDISIETYLEGAKEYSLLTIIECKNYNSTIPVNDIRELSSILNEIGEHNTKGILIANSNFQRATINLAKSSKIGLARISKSKPIEWINHRRNSSIHLNHNSYLEILEKETFSEFNFFASIEGTNFTSLPKLLINIGVIDKFNNFQKYIQPPYIGEVQVQNRIEQFLEGDCYDNFYLNRSTIERITKEKYNYEFNYSQDLGEFTFGKIKFDEKCIYISDRLNNEEEQNRFRFTLAHELGHLVLHLELLERYLEENTETFDSLNFNQTENVSNNKSLEIQANMFASKILVPETALRMDMFLYFKEKTINKGFLYLDEQLINKQLVYTLLEKLSRKYKVSKSVIKYRLIKLKLLKDGTNKSLKSLLKSS